MQRVVPIDRSSTPLLFDPNLRTPFVNQWNFSIQHQVAKDMVVELAYVGSKGTHMFRMMNANQINLTQEFIAGFAAAQRGVRQGTVGRLLDTYGATLPSTITTNLTNNDIGGFVTAVDTGAVTVNGVSTVGGRLVQAGLPQSYFRNPQFTTAALGCSCTDTSYNSLQISLNKRFSRSMMFMTNYTWAKSLDDISDDTDGAGQGLLIPTDSNNRRLDRGRSSFDIRHQFRAGLIYELPLRPRQAVAAERRPLAHRRRLGNQHHHRLVERLPVHGRHHRPADRHRRQQQQRRLHRRPDLHRQRPETRLVRRVPERRRARDVHLARSSVSTAPAATSSTAPASSRPISRSTRSSPSANSSRSSSAARPSTSSTT